MLNAASAFGPSVGVGIVLGTLELEDVVVVAGLLDGTLLVVGGGEEEVVLVDVVVEVVVGVYDVVVEGGVYVVDVVLVVVGAGGVLVHVGVVDVGSESPEEPNTHVPARTPWLVGAKKVNSPSERSRPWLPHPGHSSMIVAWVDFPPYERVIVTPQ